MNLDSLVEEILDIAREQSHVDAAVIIRDRIEKDIVKPLERELLQVYRERDLLRKKLK
jgi:hypothetical protein